MGVTGTLCLRLPLEEKAGKEVPESSRLEFLEKLLADNFAWSSAEDDTSRPSNRSGIADSILLRIFLSIYQ